MAKQRIVNTRFWEDYYVSNLDPTEKLLFLYFLTNPHTEICGIYEIPLKTVAVDTGLDKEMVEKIIARFSKDGKIFYIDGWICIKNFTKHQTINPSVEKGIQRCFSQVPARVLDRLGTDWVQPGSLNLTKPNLTKPNLSGGEKSPTPTEEAKLFFTSNERRGEVLAGVVAKGIDEKVAREEFAKFVSYWTERNKSGTKQKWELERTFEVGKRLASWFSNIGKWGNKPNKDNSLIL